jgi:starch phosphorylase
MSSNSSDHPERQSYPPASPETTQEDIRTGLTTETIQRAIVDNLFYTQGRLPEFATSHHWYMALSLTVRDRMLNHWVKTARRMVKQRAKMVSYLSAEFLMGPQLGNNLVNLGIYEQARQAVENLGLNLEEIEAQEEEPGLGNGGLGRLAACYLDSMTTLGVPATGYGIRYEFGIFDQQLRDGWQIERTDKWLQFGNPWELPRPEINFYVQFGGRTESYYDADFKYRVRWIPDRMVKGVAYDTPIPGYRVGMTNQLRLWKAEAVESFDFSAFNLGDYDRAVLDKITSENLTKVLYPNDNISQGKQLRLEQQYFFVSCSLRDMIRKCRNLGYPLSRFQDFFAIQMNDTHPSIAVAELMRLLVDENEMEWEEAWEITRQSLGYTNHTLLPEALEKWSLPLFARVLPRHLQIIYEINRRFLEQVHARFPGDLDRLRRMSLIDESGEKSVRMAHLAVVGSRTVNGVARLHTQLLKQEVLRDFHDFSPAAFHNVTNGVTPRRWVLYSNPELAALINSRIGQEWIVHPEEELPRLEPLARDQEFQHAWLTIKRRNKERLARIIMARTGMTIDPDSLFDIQVKRIHEYKRQHLNVLHMITHYWRLKTDSRADFNPRTFIFAGKAAPGYEMAKLIIKLINAVGDKINNDPAVRDRMKVVFLTDFNVKNAQPIYPAADLSEQISTAGKEASGTGNMKFAMNGAITIGTLDGANIEILEAVGADNFFLFGLSAEEVVEWRRRGYNPRQLYHADELLRDVINLIGTGFFSPDERDLFRPLVDSLLTADDYMLLADYPSYIESQKAVCQAYADRSRWAEMSILNAARVGRFSSDRSIRDYCRDIWRVDAIS